MREPHLHDTDDSDDATIVRGKTETEQPRENPAGEAPDGASHPRPVQEVLTLVCEKCGKDYFFEDEAPPEDMTCEKCGNTVFRAFDSAVGDEASDDFRDSTERDLHPDDPEGDALPGDVMDLNRI